MLVQAKDFNAQLQSKITWPSNSVVARDYLDQLARSKGLRAERSAAVKTALDRADGVRSASDRNASAVAGQLDTLASDLDRDASSSSGIDAAHLRQLAAVLKDRAQKLR